MPRTGNSAGRLVAIFALQLAACVALGSIGAAAAVPDRIKLCYLLFTRVDDLGYTFSFNVGRLKIHENVKRMFPNSTVESIAVQEVFFMSPEKKRQVLADYVRQGCHVVSTNGEMLLHDANYSEVSAMYPNVTFFTVAPDPSYVLNNEFPNIVFMVQVPTIAFYLKGAAAARQASTCVGLISAFELPGNAMDAANGALRGIRDENPTIPIHVVTMNSWYWPEAEVDAARLLMRLGCEVIMHYTDPRVIDITVQDEAPRPGFFSVGAHSDLQQYVGDTVLVASYVAWDVGLTPLIAQALRDGRPAHPGAAAAFAGGVVVPTDLSPRSSQAARDAFDRAKARLADPARPDVLCGPMRLRNGTAVVTNPSTGCLNKTQQTPIYIDATNTTFHGRFRFRGECAPGTFAVYAVAPVIALTCAPCPADTYSAAAGATECAACPNGTVAEPGSAACTRAADGGVAGWVIAVIIIAAVIVVLGGAAAAAVGRRRRGANHDAAPKKPPLCILFTDIESSTELWQAHERMGEAVETHHRIIREVLLEYGGYEVKTVGDCFMIAVAGVVDAVMIAVSIQRRLQQAEWPPSLRSTPSATSAAAEGAEEKTTDAGADAETAQQRLLFNGLKVRIGVHYCREIEPKYEGERDYWDYYGPDVNLAARVESQARGGQILLSEHALAELEVDDAFEAIVAPDIHLQVFARRAALKGVVQPVTLYTVTPIELAARVFAPLPGHENDADGVRLEISSFSVANESGTGSGDDSNVTGIANPRGITQRSLLTSLQRVLSKCPLQDRMAMAEMLARTWDGAAVSRPLAHQLRAVAAAAAGDDFQGPVALQARGALNSVSPTPRGRRFTQVLTPDGPSAIHVSERPVPSQSFNMPRGEEEAVLSTSVLS